MNNLARLLLTALVGWILLGAWYLSTSPCTMGAFTNTPAKKVAPVVATPTPAAAPAKKVVWRTADGANFKANSSAHFTFPKSDFKPTIPEPTRKAFNNVAQYLKKNPNRQLVLTGVYDSQENNTTNFANLGVARADAIKKRIVKMGAPAANILTNGFEESGLKFENNLVIDGVNFGFRGKSADEMATLAKRLKAEPLNVYFATGQNQIQFNDQLRQYFRDLKYYTDNTPNAKISVVGHTDSAGNRQSNINLGAQRAKFMMDYMLRQGFKNTQINTSSKGPDAPIASNDTDEGKAKNRRVAITLQ